MNALFITQDSSLRMHFDVMEAMKRNRPLQRVGFYVTNSRYYERFVRSHPRLDSARFEVLKEWEIIRDSEGTKPDLRKLANYERQLGARVLWDALVADRRVYLGRKYAYAQDYRPRFDHERMLSILQVSLESMERLFDTVQPDLVVSFVCVTTGDYLSCCFARNRGIPFLNLRPTRIKNYMFAGEDVLEPSARLRRTFQQFVNQQVPPEFEDQATAWIATVRDESALYEGVAPISDKPPRSAIRSLPRSVVELSNSLKTGIDLEWGYRTGRYKHDPNVSGYFGPLIGQRIVRPIRARKMRSYLRRMQVRESDLGSLYYAFFPLHVEPEVTLHVYAKPYLNQIEAVRLVSHSLPVGMKLLVKEHPWAIGKRPVSYYRRLLEIPNVMMVDPRIGSRPLIQHSKIVTVISGSIGLEAVHLGKPVVTLGRTSFTILPPGIVRHVTDPDRLSEEIRALLSDYEYDEAALVSYVAAVMKESVAVDFYTKVMGRRGLYVPSHGKFMDQDFDTERREEIQKLASYLVRQLDAATREPLVSDAGTSS